MSHGRSMLDTLTHWTPHHASPEIAEVYERKLAENATGVAVAPGAANLHTAIPPSRFGIFTGAKSFTAEARLKQCHLDRPKSLITGDMVKLGKPDPEGLVEFRRSKQLVHSSTSTRFVDGSEQQRSWAIVGLSVSHLRILLSVSKLPKRLECTPLRA